ncbi:MAG: DUF3127 domain-containing protein [Prevotellaceae bacterium]|jgi:hypothetical protein|nr:DUF3127 domain-containing protein [Prevotellaceae bacterium]
MELKAKLIQMLPLQTGEGRNGMWKKQDIIVETEGTYPKKVCISIWGDRVNPSVLVMDSMLNISFDLESREFNGRWYTDSRAWKIEPADGSIHSTPVAGAPVAGAPASQPQAPEAAPFTANEEGKDDLPF